MGIFDKLFGNKPASAAASEQPEQAVLIYLNGIDLPQDVYENYDLTTLEDQLVAALDGTGEVDGNEIGPENTIVYLYGPDSEKIFTKIEPVLNNYPLCQQAKVVIRHGKPGTTQREIVI